MRAFRNESIIQQSEEWPEQLLLPVGRYRSAQRNGESLVVVIVVVVFFSQVQAGNNKLIFLFLHIILR